MPKEEILARVCIIYNPINYGSKGRKGNFGMRSQKGKKIKTNTEITAR
jgi:hypothetical protein